MNDRARDLVLELWSKTRIDWGFATDRIADAFRRERTLSSRERREVAETLYGMIRQARRIDFALEPAAPVGKLQGMARERTRYVAYRLLAGEIGVADAQAETPGLDWLAVAQVDARIAKERDPIVRLALARSLPDWLAAAFTREYGDEADALAEALNRRAPLTIRTNTLKTTREALIATLAAEGVESRPTAIAPHGIVLETRVNAFGLVAFKDGLFEVQDEASQLVGELVAPPPKGLVVDACAGAGGKTLAIGAVMAGKGRLVATDVSARKLEELRRRARRAGLSNAQAVEIQPDWWPDEIEKLRGRADRVLVDAPCSGIGALRRNPEARWRLAEDDLVRLPAQQEAIAKRAMALVAPGGRLIYATCTVLATENERVVERLLSCDPSFTIMSVAEIWGRERAAPIEDPSRRFLKLLPHKHDTDGFFAAVLRKKPA